MAGTLCTVTFDAGSGSVDPESKSVVSGFAYGLLPTPFLEGFVFAGWWTEPEGTGAQVTDSFVVSLTSDHSLYAKWIPLPTFAEALDDEFEWTAYGDVAWVTQFDVSHDGMDAAQSGEISEEQFSWLETTVTGPGVLSFWWKVSSEPDYA